TTASNSSAERSEAPSLTPIPDRYTRHEVAAPRAVGPSGRTQVSFNKHPADTASVSSSSPDIPPHGPASHLTPWQSHPAAHSQHPWPFASHRRRHRSKPHAPATHTVPPRAPAS